MRQLLPFPAPLTCPEELEGVYTRPAGTHLRLNFVSALDGTLELEGRSSPLGGPGDRAAFTAMRAVADCVLVGAGTARIEDYGPVRLPAEVTARRLDRGQTALPPLVVVTRSGNLDVGARMFSAGSVVILLTTAAAARRRPELADVAEIVPCGEQEVDLAVALGALQKRGMGRVLCEGGPMLARDLLHARLVDELCLTMSPLLAGRHGPHIAESVHCFRLDGLIESEGMLLARYGGPVVR